ncbi:DUF1206 domain-containing protein [Pseudomonas aeruginosa]|nr:DUF1206 domain-containing protein [Pseudomonas aeruginosa]
MGSRCAAYKEERSRPREAGDWERWTDAGVAQWWGRVLVGVLAAGLVAFGGWAWLGGDAGRRRRPRRPGSR